MDVSMSIEINLDSCAQEKIHLTNAIQPHGILFGLDHDFLIQYVSDNISKITDSESHNLLGRSISTLVSKESFEKLVDLKKSGDATLGNPLAIHLSIAKNNESSFDGIVHMSDNLFILELEPAALTSSLSTSFSTFYQDAREGIAKIQSAMQLVDASLRTTEHVKKITGFDRVVMYRFDESWNGEVLAESKEDFMDSYLGLRFPASDIPEQARKLYALNWIRLIADVNYDPSPLISEKPSPLNLSFSTLRSVSPVHLEYMRNMKIASSMSISVIRDGKLWGLISCHSKEKKFVAYQKRSACEFIGQIFSYQIGLIESRHEQDHRQFFREKNQTIVRQIKQHGYLETLASAHELLQLIPSSGCVLYLNKKVFCIGETPTEKEIKELMNSDLWQIKDNLFMTDQIQSLIPDVSFAGVLVLEISPSHYILWFRPEVIQTIRWAGNPEKPVRIEDGSMRIHPRQSFELWKETVRGLSEPWDPLEVEAAMDLKNTLNNFELARLNDELAASNQELDSFVGIASHDLREPVRGIRNYAEFVLEDDLGKLSAVSVSRLATIVKISKKAENLLASLYHYSKVGRVELAMEKVDIADLLDEVLVRIKPYALQHDADISVPKNLPHLFCDRVRTGEVFYNLVLNAIKYNDKPTKKVWIDYEVDSSGKYIFSVNDNGAGIPQDSFNEIFELFKRGHGDAGYESGTGVGLTISKKIVDLHRGKIWVESALKEGSTFYFTLQA
jgi:light-regulated signal transduction histidine kinase (bacteriophytochrome)